VNAHPLLDPDEPGPVEVVGADRLGPFVVLCDHAGRALPRALGRLGLSPAELETHIAWDIGAAGGGGGRAARRAAPRFLPRYSRLVKDSKSPHTAAD
jgi:predicted N-formylglutamate amidohydrolase